MGSVEHYLTRLQSYNFKNPVLVGFGIKDKATFSAACAHANGAIIGTAFIKAIGDSENVEAAAESFLNSIIN